MDLPHGLHPEEGPPASTKEVLPASGPADHLLVCSNPVCPDRIRKPLVCIWNQTWLQRTNRSTERIIESGHPSIQTYAGPELGSEPGKSPQIPHIPDTICIDSSHRAGVLELCTPQRWLLSPGCLSAETIHMFKLPTMLSVSLFCFPFQTFLFTTMYASSLCTRA